MIGGLGYLLAHGDAGVRAEYPRGQGYLGAHAGTCHGRAETDGARRTRGASCRRSSGADDAQPDPGGQLAACAVGPVLDGPLRRTRGDHGPAAHRHPRALPRIPLPPRDAEGSECVPVLLAALGRITGTDTGADGDYAEIVATAQTTLWSLTADRHRPGSLAQSVERLSSAARAVRDQMSNDTWMVLAAVERAVGCSRSRGSSPDSQAEGEAYLASTHNLTLAGMLALSGVAAESMVQDVGWTMMDIGKRIERGIGLTALLRATMTTARSPGAEQTHHRVNADGVRVVGHLPAPQPGHGSVSPRWPSWCCSTPKTRGRWSTSWNGCGPNLKALPGVVGFVAARTAGRRGRRAAAPARSGRARGRRRGRHAGRTRRAARTACIAICGNCPDSITATQLSLPGGDAAAVGDRRTSRGS